MCSCHVLNVLQFPGAGMQIVTVTDPSTGQPVQQVMQTQIDPKTGKQVVRPLPNQNNNVQVITVQDPVTGQMKQQIVPAPMINGQQGI